MSDYYYSSRTYVGQRNGKLQEHGMGYYDVRLQGKCAGDFEENRVSGRAVKTWIQGETYVGQYLHNKKHGNGVHTWKSGATYIGQFKNNQPDGYGILTTVHDGIKFIGQVKGMIAYPISGNWYNSDNELIDPADYGIDQTGCRETSPGTIINAVGETIVHENGKTTITEKNHVTVMDSPSFGTRTTYYYGDWISRYTGSFRNGRYHGNGSIEYHIGHTNTGVFAFGNQIDYQTYTSIAEQNDITRSTQRRLDRNYCLVYDMMLQHFNKFYQDDYVPNIVEFGVGRGDHLIHLRKLFPTANIIAVDLLSPDHVPTTPLEAQQVRDLQVACKIPDIKFYFNTDCYDKQTIYDIVTAEGDFDFAIHDATHGPDVWSKLQTIGEVLRGPNGILITEEIGCTIDHGDEHSVDWEQVSQALEKGWRIWDLRPITKYEYQNNLIGVFMNRSFDGNILSTYEITDVNYR